MVKYMSTRMDKYYKEPENKSDSRTNRNKGMYSKVADDDFEKLNLKSNVSVLHTDSDLDIESIKEILNQKYERREMRRVDTEPEYEEIEEDLVEEDTKEYDLKKVIETAHKNKEPNYDRERYEHLRETQFDILRSLNINREDDPEFEETLTAEEATLMNLIKTVNENASKSKTAKNDDLLGDLLGDDQTEVLEPVQIEEEEPDKKPTIVEELEKTKQLSKIEIEDELEKLSEPIKEEEIGELEEKFDRTKELSPTEELSNSFYTGSYHIDKDDLDDFMDLEKEMNGGNIVVKILVIIIVLVTLALAIYLLNKYLNLGLF